MAAAASSPTTRGWALTENGVYIAVNNFTENTANGGFDSQSIFSIPKSDLLAASPNLANMSQFFQIDGRQRADHPASRQLWADRNSRLR